MQPHFLVLASASPRRQRLLRQIGLEFDCIPSNVDESISESVPPCEHVMILAERKARDISFKVPAGVIIGADTIVVHNDEIIGKPPAEADAIRTLQRLSGEMHSVYTGFSIIEVPGRRSVTRYEQTQVWFRKLATSEILDYVRGGSPMDKAGAYGIQDDLGAVFVERIIGDFYNVMGLPLSNFYCTFKEFMRKNEQGNETELA